MAATASSTHCSSNFLSTTPPCQGASKIRSNPSSHGSSGCRKVDGVAMWFIHGVTGAFFASLERCSCIRIVTEEDGEEANDIPLIPNDGNLGREHCTSGSLRRTGKGKKSNDGVVLIEDWSKC